VIHLGRRWSTRFDLSDDEWTLLEPLPPTSRKSARVDDRKILNAIFYVLRTRMPWRDLPERYGSHTTAFRACRRNSVEHSEASALTVHYRHSPSAFP
jgi:transposase